MLLTGGVLCLLGLALAAGGERAPASATAQQVLGTSTINDEPAELAFVSPEAAEAQLFLELINDLRRTRGADPLLVDAELELTASAWAVHMSQTRDLAHATDLSLGISSNWRKLGENVGVAPERQLNELFEAFVASPTHLANLVDPSFDLVGIGIVHVDGKLWMTQRFMDVSPTEAGVVLGRTTVATD